MTIEQSDRSVSNVDQCSRYQSYYTKEIEVRVTDIKVANGKMRDSTVADIKVTVTLTIHLDDKLPDTYQTKKNNFSNLSQINSL